MKVLTAAGRYHFFYFVAVIFFGSFYLVNLILAIVSMSYQQQQQKVNAEKQERERRKVKDDLEQQNEEARKISIVDEYLHSHEQNLDNALFFENPNRQPSYSSISIEYDQNRCVRETLFSIDNKFFSFRNTNIDQNDPSKPHHYYSTIGVLFIRIPLQLLMNIKVMIQQFHFSMMHNEIQRAREVVKYR
jgi:hypothetical protein